MEDAAREGGGAAEFNDEVQLGEIILQLKMKRAAVTIRAQRKHCVLCDLYCRLGGVCCVPYTVYRMSRLGG